MVGCSNAHCSASRTSTLEGMWYNAYTAVMTDLHIERYQDDHRGVAHQEVQGHAVSPTSGRPANTQPSHGSPTRFLRLQFRVVSGLFTNRRDIMLLALANSGKLDAVGAYAEIRKPMSELEGEWAADGESQASSRWGTRRDKDSREDIREYDVLYYLRVAIDNDIRLVLRYAISFTAGQPATSPSVSMCGTSHYGVRYRDNEGAAEVPRPGNRRGHDDFIHGFLITNREIVSEN